MSRLGFLLLFILTSCAGRTYFDREHGDPLYHRGPSAIFRPVLPLRGLIAGSSRTQADSVRPSVETPEELALTGVVLSGISLAMNRDYYKSSYLSGRCSCRFEQEPEFEVPCGRIVVVLKDHDGHVLTKIDSADGEFVFPVDKEKSYSIGIESDRYEVRRAPTEHLKMGDSIAIQLIEKSRKLGE